MKKLFRPSKPPKPTPLPPPEPVPPLAQGQRGQYPQSSILSLSSATQESLTQTLPSIHSAPPFDHPSAFSQQSNSPLLAPDPDTWFTVEPQDPHSRSSFESGSSPLPPHSIEPFFHLLPPPSLSKQHPHQSQLLPTRFSHTHHPSSDLRNHVPSANRQKSSLYIQPGSSSDKRLYETSVVLPQERPAKGGGILRWADDFREQQKDKGGQKYHQGPQQSSQINGHELTRMIGFLTATASEDWALILEVCERASASKACAKEAVKALRSEFMYGEPPTMLVAARLWAIMLRNTQPTFVAQCSNWKFLDRVEDTLSSSSTSPVVKERLLVVLAGAAYHFGGDERYVRLRRLWGKVKAINLPPEGIPFDLLDPMFSPPSQRLPRGQPTKSTPSAPIYSRTESSPSGEDRNKDRGVAPSSDREDGELTLSNDHEDGWHALSNDAQLKDNPPPRSRSVSPSVSSTLTTTSAHTRFAQGSSNRATTDTPTLSTANSQQDQDPVLLASTSVTLNNDITGSVSLEGTTPVGYGGFGDLFLGAHRDCGKVALKKPRKLLNEALTRRFLREVDLWCSVSHPHILACLGMCKVGLDIYVVSPFIENGDLFACMARGMILNRSKLLFEVAEALTHLHHRGIVHGDVKAQNILLADDGSALLCDFGLAKAFDTMVTSTEAKGDGSTRWMAPELFEDEGRSMASDVYSLGITIAEVVSGHAPYPGISSNMAVMRYVADRGGRPAKDPLHSPEGISYVPLWETAEKCWVRDPRARPHMAQVLGMLFSPTRGIV